MRSWDGPGAVLGRSWGFAAPEFWREIDVRFDYGLGRSIFRQLISLKIICGGT